MLPSPLPPVLAGPILRRVDWDSVSVWIALSKAAQVELTLYEGTPADATPFASHFVAQGTAPLASATASTRKIGAKLHIALVTASLSGAAVLKSNEVYSYQIRLDGTDDLKSLGLLEDNDDDPAHPWLALGYDEGTLPSFVSPPMEVADLVLLHGSCRKAHGAADDAMAFIDGIIDHTRGTPRRPHQLFLTGDQIYADDVPSALLRELTECGAELLGAAENITVPGALHPMTVTNFPPGRRQELMTETALFSSTDAGSHLISFGEFCAAHLFAWSNVVWPDALQQKDDVLDDDAPDSAIDDLLSSFGSDAFERAEDEFKAEIKTLREYRKRLPEIRRALANVPVLMIFDDHEITDDWNLTEEWWTRLLTSTNVLGRTVLMNGLAAYVLFQGWGNDPGQFAVSPGSDFLDHISAFFANDPGPDPLAVTAFFQKIEANPPVLRWHYIIERPRYRFIVLDTRTRRSYATEIGPPALLSSAALDEQIPPWLPPLDATIIISAAPVLGLPVLEKALPMRAKLFQAERAFDHPILAWWRRHKHKEESLLEYDIEAWSFDTPAFESLLARLYDFNRVVLLGGDVHYAFSMAMTYWRNGTNPRRFAQLTASPLKNTAPFSIEVLKSTVGTLIFDNVDRSEAMLGWTPPVTVTDPPSALDLEVMSRLAASPVVLPEGSDVTLDRVADWSWRVELQRDTRPDDGSPGSRPPTVAWPQLDLDINFSPQNSDAFYTVSLGVHGKHLLNHTPRAVVWSSSLGEITFEKTAGQDVFVRHSFIYVTSAGLQPDQPQPWVQHRIQIGSVTDTNVPELDD